MSKRRHEKKNRLIRIADKRMEKLRERSGEIVSGKLKMTHSGYGFVEVTPEEGKEKIEDVFIPIPYLNGAMDGDIVKVQLIPPKVEYRSDTANRGASGRILEVEQRTKESFVAELLPGGVARPLNPKLPDEIKVYGPRKGAVKGDWVRIRKPEFADGAWGGTVSAVLGKAGVISADLDAVMEEFEIPHAYSAEDNAAALAVEPREIERTKLPKLFVLTIDPTDAKDFDDALSVEPGEKEGTVEVGVHIADVAAYIAPQSKFDQQAARRGFSCYLPGRTLPMLPAGLTAHISMQAGVPSLAHSVFLTVETATGKVLSHRRQHTVVTVAHRLDYDKVQQFADTKKAPAEWPPKLKKKLKELLEITAAMRRYRYENEQYIELPLHEVHVVCDEAANKLLGIEPRISRPAEQLVEECMLAANSAVGAEMVEKSISGIYRIHGEPEPEKLMEFCDMAEQFGCPVGNLSSREGCNEFIRNLPDNPKREVILNLLLRSFPRAEYAAKPLFHYALGKSAYAHFTSPIRRYTDLTVHQQLWNFDRKQRTRRGFTLERIAAQCTEQEERTDDASFAASDRMKMRILDDKLNAGESPVYEAVISKVISAGVQVSVGELGLYGFVPKEVLSGERKRGKYALYREHSESSCKLGDYIYVRPARIDFARGSVIFVPAGR